MIQVKFFQVVVKHFSYKSEPFVSSSVFSMNFQ